jgi:hypothetical protein
MPEPDWQQIGTCLRLSVRGPRAGMSGARRRGNGVRGPGAVATQQQWQRDVATLQSWHKAMVRDGALQDLMGSTPEVPPPSSIDAARSSGRLPSVGPSLVKSMLGVLTLTKRIHFDVGVMPPGSYSSARYLLTGDPALTRRSLWPWSRDPQGTHHHIEKLAHTDGCAWQDMQGALLLGSSAPLSSTRSRSHCHRRARTIINNEAPGPFART